MVLGRTHIKDVAAKRKIELNSYLQSLMSASADVAEVTILTDNNNINNNILFFVLHNI